MTTTVHHSASRRAVPGFVLAVVALAALAAFLFPAVTSGSTSDSPAVVHEVTPAYPREVRVADLADPKLRDTALQSAPPVTVLVEIAPGVYAARRPGPLGSAADYPAVFGSCAAVNRYAQSHVVARTCW